MHDSISLNNMVASAVRSFIQEKFDQEHLRTRFPNKLLREDVLALLDTYCTVVYYPLEHESNNGFHVSLPDVTGVNQQFVFINTAQTIEKQVFTAAHELGHIWEVDAYVCIQCDLETSDEASEHIINRFAAELLMPEDQFRSIFINTLSQYRTDKGITVYNLMKTIAALINHFCVPYKSVVYRFAELDIFQSPVIDLLLGKSKLSEEDISSTLDKILVEDGYQKFLEPTFKKWIDGLAELLDKAESTGSVSTQKIELMRTKFDLTQPSSDVELDEVVEVTDTERC